MTTRAEGRRWALTLMFAAALMGCEEGGSEPTTMAGACGMEGMQVECLVASDCDRYERNDNWCTDRGSCTHGFPGDFQCFNIGEPCLFSEKVCGSQGLCTYPCSTHSDCPDTYFCACYPGGSFCHWARCREGGCSAGSHYDEGSLLCILDSRDGDCLGYNNACPDGFSLVASNVGFEGGMAACVADATPL